MYVGVYHQVALSLLQITQLHVPLVRSCKCFLHLGAAMISRLPHTLSHPFHHIVPFTSSLIHHWYWQVWLQSKRKLPFPTEFPSARLAIDIGGNLPKNFLPRLAHRFNRLLDCKNWRAQAIGVPEASHKLAAKERGSHYSRPETFGTFSIFSKHPNIPFQVQSHVTAIVDGDSDPLTTVIWVCEAVGLC